MKNTILYASFMFALFISCKDKSSEIFLQGNIYTEKGKYDERLADNFKQNFVIDSALYYYDEALRCYEKTGKKAYVGRMKYNIANLYYRIGDFSRANQEGIKALYYLNEQDDPEDNIFRTYRLLGVISDELGDYKQAEKYYKAAIKSIKKYEFANASLLNNLGIVYGDLNNYKKAVLNFEKALHQKNLKEKRPLLYARLLCNLAYSQFKLKNYNGLPDLFYRSLAIRDSLKHIPGIVINKIQLSEYYQDQNNSSEAIRFAKEAYITAKTKGIDPRDVLSSLKQLKAVDTTNSLVYANQYIKISDSIKKSEPKLTLNVIQKNFEKDILEYEKAKKEETYKKFVFYFVIISFIIILFFMAKIIHSKSKQNKHKNKQQEEKEEIYNKLIQTKDDFLKVSNNLTNKVLNQTLDLKNKLNSFDDYFKRELNNLEITLENASKLLKESQNSFTILLEHLIVSYDNNVEYRIEPYNWDTLDNSLKVSIYKILREILNSIQGSEKTMVELFVNKHNHSLELIVSNNQNVFANETVKTKLKNCTYLANEAGGNFNLDDEIAHFNVKI